MKSAATSRTVSVWPFGQRIVTPASFHSPPAQNASADLSAKCNSRRRALHRTALRPGFHGYASAKRSFVALGSNQLEQNTGIRAFMMVASFPPGYVFGFLAGMVVLQLI